MSDREMLELAANWKADGMTREQHLNILILISALESLILAQKVPVPAGLFEDIDLVTEALRKEILQ
jgi:hypothetical protein